MAEAPNLDTLRDETNDLDVEWVEVPLGPNHNMIRVMPSRLWRSSTLRDLNNGQFDDWAYHCLDDASYTTWQDLDPTVGDIQNMMIEFRDLEASADPLPTRRQRRSSRSTHRR